MNKSKKIFILFLTVFLLTGCTKYKNYDNKAVTINSTGQKVVENILCKTSETEKQYEQLKNEKINEYQEKLNRNEINEEEFNNKKQDIENSFNISNVPNCSEFHVFSGNDGLWTTVFVKSLSWIIIAYYPQVQITAVYSIIPYPHTEPAPPVTAVHYPAAAWHSLLWH